MTKLTRETVRLHLRNIRQAGILMRGQSPMTAYPAKANAKALKNFRTNAQRAQRAIGLPAKLYVEICRAYRQLLGLNQLVEAAFITGLTAGWIEGRNSNRAPNLAQLQRALRRGYRKKTGH